MLSDRYYPDSTKANLTSFTSGFKHVFSCIGLWEDGAFHSLFGITPPGKNKKSFSYFHFARLCLGLWGFLWLRVWVSVLFLIQQGKKLQLAQLITPAYQSKQAPGGRAALLSLAFLSWHKCEAVVSTNWISPSCTDLPESWTSPCEIF